MASSLWAYIVAALLMASIAAVAIVVSKRLSGLEIRFKALTDRVTPISAAFRSELIRDLTHNHTPELDALLAKVGADEPMTPEEETRLNVLLKERVVEYDDPLITDRERDSASMLLMVNKRVHAERTAIALQIVAVAVARSE